MAENRKQRVYLSGPISYYIHENRLDECKAIFERAKNNLEAYGYEVVSPFDNGVDDDAPWIRHIIADLDLLDTCDIICYLHTSDLYYSAGSLIEKISARHNRMIEFREIRNFNEYSYINLAA